MRLTVVLPVCGDELLAHVEGEVRSWASLGTKIEVINIEKGPASIESEYDEALAGPGILHAVQTAVDDGAEAVFISCFGDPAVHGAREIVDVPVVGGFEPAMLTALSLGERVGIVTVLPNVLPMIRGLLNRNGLSSRCDAIEVVDLPVLSLGDEELLVERLYERARSLVDGERADVIVLGCTGMVGVAARLQSRLEEDGTYVPVVDPSGAAIMWLESALRLGVRPSRTTYMPPPPKVRNL